MTASAAPRGEGPPRIRIDILVEDEAWGTEESLGPLVERAVGAAVASGALDVPEDAELSVVFTDDARVRVLNRDYRGLDKPTNVLSFPGHDAASEEPGPMLGDIVIARETTTREALDEGKPVEHHVVHLIVHGLLHVFGHDHETEEEAEAMERLETAILTGLGIPDPYAGTEPDSGARGDHARRKTR